MNHIDKILDAELAPLGKEEDLDGYSSQNDSNKSFRTKVVGWIEH